LGNLPTRALGRNKFKVATIRAEIHLNWKFNVARGAGVTLCVVRMSSKVQSSALDEIHGLRTFGAAAIIVRGHGGANYTPQLRGKGVLLDNLATQKA
jgi:hypothetical protein